MRHAFDADHIAAIDNTTRKLMIDGQRPLGVGFFFSLGHSTIVFLLAAALAVGIRGLSGAVEDEGSALQPGDRPDRSDGFRRVPGPARRSSTWSSSSASSRSSGGCAGGEFDERELEDQLDKRGLMNRFYGRATRSVTQVVADVPGRAAVRARVRHGDRDRAARDRRHRRRRRPADLRDPLPADPVRRRHDACSTRSTARS